MNDEQLSKLKKGDLIINIISYKIYIFSSFTDNYKVECLECAKFGDKHLKPFSWFTKNNKTIVPLDDYYKVGDTVKIRSEYHEGCNNHDYRCSFSDGMLEAHGGKEAVIIEKKDKDCFIVNIDPYYNWSPEMFECKIKDRDIVKKEYIERTHDIYDYSHATRNMSKIILGSTPMGETWLWKECKKIQIRNEETKMEVEQMNEKNVQQAYDNVLRQRAEKEVQEAEKQIKVLFNNIDCTKEMISHHEQEIVKYKEQLDEYRAELKKYEKKALGVDVEKLKNAVKKTSQTTKKRGRGRPKKK